jgi:hypothetical protein
MIAARQIAFGGGKRKPYDAEVEYLESTGTQWIDTGYVPHVPIYEQYYIQCTIPEIDTPWQCWFGSSANEKSRTVLFRQRNSLVDSLQAYIPRNDANYYVHTTVSGAQVGKKIEVIVNPTGGYFRFSTAGSYVSLGMPSKLPTESSITQKSVYVFKNESNVRSRVMRVYGFKIEDYATSESIMDLIPVRIKTVGAMYDKVSGELFRNQGTGNFIIGDDL